MSEVRYHLDTSGVDHFLDKYDDGIPYETVLALEGALVTLFEATQQHVHIVSGRLKASGRIDSKIDDDTWEGSITYGGPQYNVRYAEREQDRQGDHDFIKPSDMARGSHGCSVPDGVR